MVQVIRNNSHQRSVGHLLDDREGNVSVRYDSRIENGYRYYQSLIPLDIEAEEVRNLEAWINNNQYSKLVFAQLIDVLQRSADLNDFIDVSKGDFDNLALVIESAVVAGLISVNKGKGSTINTSGLVCNDSSVKDCIFNKSIVPKNIFNQFPCNEESRVRRVVLFKQRYPFAEHLKFGIIGDDDLLSIEFKNDAWAWPVVIETDESIVRVINDNHERVKIYSQDIRDFSKLPAANLQTFITDPPYTLHGALSFIYAGLAMLAKSPDEKEFYVIMNETMIGRSLLKLQNILSLSGVYLIHVTENFSQYSIPEHFAERRRADIFMNKMSLSPETLTKSSSSNLYIFKTTNPNLKELEGFINLKAIYEHY